MTTDTCGKNLRFSIAHVSGIRSDAIKRGNKNKKTTLHIFMYFTAIYVATQQQKNSPSCEVEVRIAPKI